MENYKYEANQISCMSILEAAINNTMYELDMASWKKVRRNLGEDKCKMLSEIFKWQNDDEA